MRTRAMTVVTTVAAAIDMLLLLSWCPSLHAAPRLQRPPPLDAHGTTGPAEPEPTQFGCPWLTTDGETSGDAAASGSSRIPKVRLEPGAIQPVRLVDGRHVFLPAACLEVIRNVAPAPPTAIVPPSAQSIPPMRSIEVSLAGGLGYGPQGSEPSKLSFANFVTYFYVTLSPTEHISWPTLPALAYRGGTMGHIEWIVWGGVYTWGIDINNDEEVNARVFGRSLGTWPEIRALFYMGAGLDLRFWVLRTGSVNLSSASLTSAIWSPKKKNRESPRTWAQGIWLGYSYTWEDRVTFNLSGSLMVNWLYNGDIPPTGVNDPALEFRLGIGSVQTRGMRQLPLIQVHLTRLFSVDVYASSVYHYALRASRQTFMLGATAIFPTHATTRKPGGL